MQPQIWPQAGYQMQALGFASIPVSQSSKRPLVKWGEFQATPPTSSHFEEWGETYSDAGVGILTGKPSRAIALDIDGADGWASIRGRHLPPTPAYHTQRGVHYLYAHPGPRYHLGNRIGAFPGVDIKADGGIAIPPPGKHREWIDGLTPHDLSPAPAPDWLLELCEPTLIEPERPVREDRVGDRVKVSSGRAPGLWTPKPTTEARYSAESLPVNLAERAQAVSQAIGRYGHGPGMVIVPEAPVPGSYVPVLTSETVRDLNTLPEFSVALSVLCGCPYVEPGKPFCCPIHEERNPSASLYRVPSTGLHIFKDWHGRDELESAPLAGLRAARNYGCLRQLNPPELLTWNLRLLVESGVVDPCPVPHAELWPGARPAVRRVWDGFRLLLACKWLVESGSPTMFSRSFAAAWCGVSDRHAGEAIHELTQRRKLSITGSYLRSPLYLPNTGH